MSQGTTFNYNNLPIREFFSEAKIENFIVKI